MVNRDQDCARIISVNDQIQCNTRGNQLPVNYGPLAQKVLNRWRKDELEGVVISWQWIDFPIISLGERGGSHLTPEDSTSSVDELKLILASNRISFAGLRDEVHNFCGSMKGFGRSFWVSVEFGDSEITISIKELES